MRSYLAPLLIFALSSVSPGCGQNEGPQIDHSDAEKVWTSLHSTLHQFHQESLLNTNPVERRYFYDCDQGSILMDLRFHNDTRSLENISDLVHQFRDCQIGDLVLNGEVNYINLTFCDNNTPNFDVDGFITAEDSVTAECEVSGQETCGQLSGEICGRRMP